MDSGKPLHVLFFPFLARSHMIPVLDIARLFSEYGVKTSIVTTPANAHLIHPLLHHHPSISLHLIPFPSTTFNLPSGCENLTVLPLHLVNNFFSAVSSLRDPLSHLLSSLHPDAIISDAIYTWTTELAGEFHIPRIIFQVSGLFSLSAANDLDLHLPYNSISDDSELFSIPGFPHTVHLTRSQLPEVFSFPVMLDWLREAELSSHAVIVNSFSALEPDYTVHYSNVAPREVFLLGPVAIAGQPEKKEKKAEPCLEWLDEKDDGSVVYVGFGTMSRFTAEQIKELAFGLENSGEGSLYCTRNFGSGLERILVLFGLNYWRDWLLLKLAFEDHFSSRTSCSSSPSTNLEIWISCAEEAAVKETNFRIYFLHQSSSRPESAGLAELSFVTRYQEKIRLRSVGCSGSLFFSYLCL